MRKCEHKTCNNPVFGTDKVTRKGYCKYHQHLRTDKKPQKQKVKPSGPSGQMFLFDTIWNTRERVSFISELPLDEFDKERGSKSEYYHWCFAHVLNKNTYSLYKLVDRGIVLLTPREHTLYDQGTDERREEYTFYMAEKGVVVDWGRLYELADRLRREANG